MDKVTEGWAVPATARRAHYFREKRALCGKWAFTGWLDPDDDRRGDECASCIRQLEIVKATRPA